ncbi:MAG: hypothetical protein A2X69_13345 [Rhodobacteraceae bacterium GWF1_65_7]|nr:MAG: hypothetical protein A2X69_13345 [Rhodobacteraceae bacterium GWF1_65_7]
MRKGLAIVGVLLLSACAGTQSTRVGAEMILPPQAPQMKMQSQELFLMASHLNPDVLPDYPADLLAEGPEQATVCAELVVDENGVVVWTAPLRAGPQCPPEALPALAPFERAVEQAVRRWQFTAAAVCTFPPGVEKNDDCAGEGVVEKTVPLRMAFVFDFSRSERRGRFSSASGR